MLRAQAQPLRPAGARVRRRVQLQKLATLVVENFGRLGKEGSNLIDQAAASTVGGTDGTSLARKGVCKERLLRVLSMTTQVVISRRVYRYKLALRDRQAAGGRREHTGGVLVPNDVGMACRRGVGSKLSLIHI